MSNIAWGIRASLPPYFSCASALAAWWSIGLACHNRNGCEFGYRAGRGRYVAAHLISGVLVVPRYLQIACSQPSTATSHSLSSLDELRATSLASGFCTPGICTCTCRHCTPGICTAPTRLRPPDCQWPGRTPPSECCQAASLCQLARASRRQAARSTPPDMPRPVDREITFKSRLPTLGVSARCIYNSSLPKVEAVNHF